MLLRDRFIYGFLWGILLPTIGFAALYFINDLIDRKSILGANFYGFKDSTVALTAICFNLIPTYFANRRYMDNFIRGIMIPTVIASFAWFFYFDALQLF